MLTWQLVFFTVATENFTFNVHFILLYLFDVLYCIVCMYLFIYTCKCYDIFYIVANSTDLSPKQCINEVLFKQKHI